MKKFLVSMLCVVTVGSLAANFLIYKRLTRHRPLMRIGNDAILVKDYQEAIDTEYGKPVLTRLAYALVIQQAAKKAGVMPTDAELDAELKKIERRNPRMLEAAKRDPYRNKQLRETVITQMALDNLRIKDIKVSDTEAAAYYAAHKKSFALPIQASTTVAVAMNPVDARTAESLLAQKDMTLDVIARQPRLGVIGMNGFNPDWRSLPPDSRERIGNAVLALKPGQVTIVPVDGVYFVARSDRKAEATIPPFAKIQKEVVRAARLTKAPTSGQMLAQLYHDAKVTFEVEKYSVFFQEIEEMERRMKTPATPEVKTAQR
jgi:hypothetical protein